MEEENITGNIGEFIVTYSPIIGRGTFGTVHEAVHRITKTKCAAKQLFIMDGGRKNDYMSEMADRELQILQNLQDHQNIVKVLDHFIKQSACWIFLEYCDLGTLKEYLSKSPALDLLAKVKLMLQSASSVAFMHRQDPPVIHRDIKLENIMMKREGGDDVVKLTDFGLSKLCDQEQALSKAFHEGQYMTTTCGSQYYMAPEFSAEFKGGVKYDASVDTFALGLVQLVVLESGPGIELLPRSVEAKQQKHYVSIGQEMIGHHKENHPFPTVVEVCDDDCLAMRRVKRIISNMTKFKPIHRKQVTEVEEEMSVDQISSEIRVNEDIQALKVENAEIKTSLTKYAADKEKVEAENVGLHLVNESQTEEVKKLQEDLSGKEKAIEMLSLQSKQLNQHIDSIMTMSEERHAIDVAMSNQKQKEKKLLAEIRMSVDYGHTAERARASMNQATCEVLVSGVDKHIDNDILKWLFQSKHNDGGPVTHIRRDEQMGTAVITFLSSTDAASVAKKDKLLVRGRQLQVRLNQADTHKLQLKVTGIRSYIAEDELQSYFENEHKSGGGPIEQIKLVSGAALISFKDDRTIEKIMQKYKDHGLRLGSLLCLEVVNDAI